MGDRYILFDIPEGEAPLDRELLEGLGIEVMVCHGPVPHPRGGEVPSRRRSPWHRFRLAMPTDVRHLDALCRLTEATVERFGRHPP